MKYLFIGLILLSFCACTDNLFNAGTSGTNVNAISFNVTSGIISDAKTRSQSSEKDDTLNLLQPLVLRSTEVNFPLYLHTYVAEEEESNACDRIATRAAQVNTIEDFVGLNKDNGFKLEAYEAEGSPFIPPFAVAKPQSSNTTENVWNTAPTYYWPVDNRLLGFYAFAPMSAENLLKDITVNNTDKTISFDYEVPKGTVEGDVYNDAEVQPDIMFAITECNKSTSKDGKVPMNFRHALSAIKFAVRDVIGGTIERISILGVAGKAHCVYTRNTEKDAFVWSNYDKANTSYTQTFNYETIDKTSEDEVINAQMPSKTFLLIPQEILSDAEIEVVFKRASDAQTFTMKGKIRDNNVTRWEPGKEYIYTISTSSSNWIYHFEVLGSEQEINDDEPSKGAFKDSETQIIVNQTVTEGAYYKVKSYRTRANNQKQTEPVAWEITNITEGVTTKPAELNRDMSDIDMTLNPKVWIPNPTTSGKGSVNSHEQCYIDLHPQMVGTNYNGDWDLRGRKEFGTSDSPIDLSTIYGQMNTANCYVVNAPGYYKFPLVYGNAIKNGQTNEKCYKYKDPGVIDTKSEYGSITNFQDYKGNPIERPKITGANDATLVWQDAYNLISEVSLNSNDGTYGTVSFKVNRENLQQGNAVIAIRDVSRTIIWSWHIWVSDHWTNANSLELTGDFVMPTKDNGFVTGNKIYAAPQNLGWCDPKDVWYLKRTGTITFVQDKSGNIVELPVEQREKKIEYWIGNNTYYQFGRKDPMVGFLNGDSKVKYNFGPYHYNIEAQPKNIQYSIQHPNILFVGGVTHNSDGNGYDWLSTHHYNLWNNTNNVTIDQLTYTTGNKFQYSGIKTVYDPCPAGYMVPPVGFFKQITNDQGKDKLDDALIFNGKAEIYKTIGEKKYYLYKINTETPGKYMILYGTGHRWYATNGGVGPGDNFNPQIAYLWSSQILFTQPSAYGLALGGNDNTSNFHFIGRRAMARPVRPIKEFE